jgi:NarL family two-component system response regulator LiaR
MEPVSVLLVNHSPILPPVLAQALQENDEVVVIGRVSGGKDPMELALALRPQVILVELPESGLTGLTTIGQLRAALPEVGIIVLIALPNRSHREVILAAGADEVVSNATLGTYLLPAIRRVT